MKLKRKKAKPHPGAIDIAGIDFLDDSAEIARLWIQNQGGATCLIRPDLLAEPEMFGLLMVDCIRHAARAWSQTGTISEADAEKRIWAGVDMERDHHTTDLLGPPGSERPN